LIREVTAAVQAYVNDEGLAFPIEGHIAIGQPQARTLTPPIWLDTTAMPRPLRATGPASGPIGPGGVGRRRDPYGWGVGSMGRMRRSCSQR
jgi:hypothetical protein